jgi:Zn-dependent oligopeptidase
MAESTNHVFTLIEEISKIATKKAKKELQELKKYFNLKKIETYDLAYYSRKYKEEKYNFDEKELKKYFEVENVINYLHRFVENFYSIKIKQIDVNSYNKDVRVYEVYKN